MLSYRKDIREGIFLYAYHRELHKVVPVEVYLVYEDSQYMILDYDGTKFRASFDTLSKKFHFTAEDAEYYHDIPLTDEELTEDYESHESPRICSDCRECVLYKVLEECWGSAQTCDRFQRAEKKQI